jgi:hypothetical protein
MWRSLQPVLRIFCTVFFCSLVFTACKNNEDPDLTKVCYQQIEALNRGDVKAYMATMDETSPVFLATQETFGKLTAVYRLKAEIEDIEILSLENNRATVKIKQITKKVSGPEFMDNRSIFEHTLRKSGGTWKFVETKVIKVEKL